MNSSENSPLLSAKSGYDIKAINVTPSYTNENVTVRTGSFNSSSQPAGEVTLSTKRLDRKRWISVYIMYFTMFISSMTFSIVLSSMWPYLLKVDPSSTTTFLGYVVAMYSVGQLVASPLFGVWSNYRPVREPLLISISFNIVANLLYSYVDAFPDDKKFVLLVARTFVGFGAGNVAVVRAYIAGATTESERTGAMAGVSACQAIGFIVGPALGLAFQPLGSSGVVWSPIKLELNLYTGPGFLSALLLIINFILIIILFRECRIFTEVKKIPKCLKCLCCRCMCCRRESLIEDDSDSEDEELAQRFNGVTVKQPVKRIWHRLSEHFDPVAAGVSLVLFFVVLFIFAIVETLASPLTLDEFGWSRSDSTLYNNIMFACSALIAVATFIAVKFISKRVDERNILVVGFFITAFGLFVVMPFPGIFMPVKAGLIGNANTSNSSVGHNFTHDFVISPAHSEGGCDLDKQPWCAHVPGIYLWQYIVGFGLVSVGYPIGNVMSYSIFSKILGSRPQVSMQMTVVCRTH
jgi:ceroid-lipofuscinosis MFS transporter 7